MRSLDPCASAQEDDSAPRANPATAAMPMRNACLLFMTLSFPATVAAWLSPASISPFLPSQTPEASAMPDPVATRIAAHLRGAGRLRLPAPEDGGSTDCPCCRQSPPA